jgi:hypothetical protein
MSEGPKRLLVREIHGRFSYRKRVRNGDEGIRRSNKGRIPHYRWG